jgi:phosphoribosylglycinamide formyltransferase-1
MKPARIAIFASGSGSNAQKIVEYFDSIPEVTIPLLITENKSAGVLNRLKDHSIDCRFIPLSRINSSEFILPLLEETYEITHIALAGYLKLIPAFLIQSFPNKIVNLHPALLPKYGGKGMYGKHVHQAVKNHNETKTGITIHLVNEKFDEGTVILQKTVPLTTADTVDDIEAKVRILEHKYYPKTLHEITQKMYT